MKRPAPMKVVFLRAAPASIFFMAEIENTPTIEARYPTIARSIGIIRYSVPISSLADAITIAAIIEPTKDSKMSAPMPATSPTLSPTLSAITPGFLGSSSGIPASTFPTKSAPTSAALVYMPPPTRAKRAIDDAPMPNPAILATVRKSVSVK